MVRRAVGAGRPRLGAAALAALVAVTGCGAGGGAEGPLPENPTFASHVGEIVYTRCAGCHRTGGIAPFSLESYEQAFPWADAIAAATRAGRMPPWLPEPGDYAFADEARLTEREIAILERWAADGAPSGDLAAAPPPPVAATEWALGEPDLVLEMPAPYSLSAAPHGGASHADVFRNFVLPVPLTERRWVRAIEFRPEGGGVVHHATMGVDATSASRHEDARDPEPGFDGLHSSSRVRQPAGFVLGWTPGSEPRWNPDGLAWPLDPGTDFVVQAHLMPASAPVDLRLEVGLHFGPEPSAASPLVKNLYLLGRTIDIPAGESRYVVEDRFTFPVGVEVLALYPHAHYLARSVEVEATLPGGEERSLLRIPAWDFDWQQVYPFAAPVALPAGTEVRMRFVFDNSAANPRNPNDPPARVTYGLTSADEMAEVWIQARPADRDELAVLQESVDRKRSGDYLALFDHLARIDPGNALAHSDLAAVLAGAGRVDEAAGHYATALALEPGAPAVHYELGLLLEMQGEGGAAVEHLEEALRLFPSHAGAEVALARIAMKEGRTAEAEAHAGRAASIDPRDPAPHLLLASLARSGGDATASVDHLRRASAAAPSNAGLHYDLASALVLAGSADEAVDHLRRGAALAPADVSPRLAAGWVLASHPDAAIRAPEAALLVASDLRATLGEQDPVALDLFAAALASAGRFDEAAEHARMALERASAPAQAQLAVWIRGRLDLYRARRPYLDAGGPYTSRSGG